MATVHEFVNKSAERYLMLPIALPMNIGPAERNSLLILGMVRALTIMADSKGFDEEDVHQAVKKEFELMEAAKLKMGTPQ